MISDDELAALCQHIATLEDQCQWLMKERELHARGPEAVKALGVESLVKPGYTVGGRGQLCATSTEAAQKAIQEFWPIPESARIPRKKPPPKP